MKKTTYIGVVITLIISLVSCKDSPIDTAPLNNPSSKNFLSAKKEVELAVNNAYRAFYWLGNNVPYPIHLDNATDLGWIRATYIAGGAPGCC